MELESLSTDLLSLMCCGGTPADGGGGAVFSDVTFSVEGRQIPAHRCILAARCHFFRLMFSHHHEPSSLITHPPLRPSSYPHLFVPLDVVGCNAFLALLRFLYSGQLILSAPLPSSFSSPCPLPSCPHNTCSYAVDLLLQLIPAANFFGVHQLADLVQTKLSNVLEEGVSMETLMRVLILAKKHQLQRVWRACVDLVMNAGLDCDILRRYLPREVVAELAETTLQRTGCMQNNMQIFDHAHYSQHLITSPSSCSMMCSINAGVCCSDEQKILRLQQALDCMDVELVRLMVIGEGLNLDKALALHYSVANCNREVVKALLELGVVDVNYSDSLGRTALHLAADMGNADMIAVLLDHHADPNVLTHDGFTAVDILRGLIKASGQDHFHHDQHPAVMPVLCKADQKRIHLCVELLQSAVAVAGREDVAESSCITQAASQIFTTNRNQDAPAFKLCRPAAVTASGIPISGGLRLMDGGEVALPIRDDQFCNTPPEATQSSHFDSSSCRSRPIGDDQKQPIIGPLLNIYESAAPGSSQLSSIPPPVLTNKVKHAAASISSNDLNQFSMFAQTTPEVNRNNVINAEETSSFISPGAVDHNVNHGLFLVNARYTGAYQDAQSIPITENTSTNLHLAAQDEKEIKAGKGSNS